MVDDDFVSRLEYKDKATFNLNEKMNPYIVKI